MPHYQTNVTSLKTLFINYILYSTSIIYPQPRWEKLGGRCCPWWRGTWRGSWRVTPSAASSWTSSSRGSTMASQPVVYSQNRSLNKCQLLNSCSLNYCQLDRVAITYYTLPTTPTHYTLYNPNFTAHHTLYTTHYTLHHCKHTSHSCVVGCKERGGPYLRWQP